MRWHLETADCAAAREIPLSNCSTCAEAGRAKQNSMASTNALMSLKLGKGCPAVKFTRMESLDDDTRIADATKVKD